MNDMNPSRPLLVEIQFQAKTYDIDYASIVHNLVYFRWLEDLRLKILAEHYPMEKMLANQQSPILEKSSVTYIRPLRLFDEPIGRMWVSELTRARWFIEAEFVLGDLEVATARQSGYFMDLGLYKPIRIPQPLRDSWEAEFSPESPQL